MLVLRYSLLQKFQHTNLAVSAEYKGMIYITSVIGNLQMPKTNHHFYKHKHPKTGHKIHPPPLISCNADADLNSCPSLKIVRIHLNRLSSQNVLHKFLTKNTCKTKKLNDPVLCCDP